MGQNKDTEFSCLDIEINVLKNDQMIKLYKKKHIALLLI